MHEEMIDKIIDCNIDFNSKILKTYMPIMSRMNKYFETYIYNAKMHGVKINKTSVAQMNLSKCHK